MTTVASRKRKRTREVLQESQDNDEKLAGLDAGAKLLQYAQVLVESFSENIAHDADKKSLAEEICRWETVLSKVELREARPEHNLATEVTRDLENSFNKIADHAAETNDALVDAVQGAEVAALKSNVFRALANLRDATQALIARMEIQATEANESDCLPWAQRLNSS